MQLTGQILPRIILTPSGQHKNLILVFCKFTENLIISSNGRGHPHFMADVHAHVYFWVCGAAWALSLHTLVIDKIDTPRVLSNAGIVHCR